MQDMMQGLDFDQGRMVIRIMKLMGCLIIFVFFSFDFGGICIIWCEPKPSRRLPRKCRISKTKKFVNRKETAKKRVRQKPNLKPLQAERASHP